LRLNKPLKSAVLEIYNAYGQKVKQIDNLTGQAIILHRDKLISGLYFFRLTDCKETLAVDKFLITGH